MHHDSTVCVLFFQCPERILPFNVTLIWNALITSLSLDSCVLNLYVCHIIVQVVVVHDQRLNYTRWPFCLIFETYLTAQWDQQSDV